ncbi:hypothetical protein M231_04328 [Tremella mesenterica]|uniref:Transcription factor domain-containing protein n=1 Tax=Tremella mesenterica TaxID=5217 RepID=A0A4Q1BKX3_TREME|nr:hypothetical protein M231_04328 [Tremella mesenterica]
MSSSPERKSGKASSSPSRTRGPVRSLKACDQVTHRRGPKRKVSRLVLENNSISPHSRSIPVETSDPQTCTESDVETSWTSLQSPAGPSSSISSQPSTLIPAHAGPSQVPTSVDWTTDSLMGFPLSWPEWTFGEFTPRGSPTPHDPSTGQTDGDLTKDITAFLESHPRMPAPQSDTVGVESVVDSACEHLSDPHLIKDLQMPEVDELVRQKLQVFFAYLWWYAPNVEEQATFAAFDRQDHDRSIKFRALVLAMGAMATSFGLRLAANKDKVQGIAQTYLKSAQMANALADPYGDTAVADVATAHILYMTCVYLGTEQQAWLHLQQALTRGQLLGLDAWDDPPLERPQYWSTRLKLYYTLCNAERFHAFLQPRIGNQSQVLRYAGRPWEHTQAFRARLDPSTLSRFPKFHIEMLNLMDEKVVYCWQKRCGAALRGCNMWTIEQIIHLQRQLGHLFDEAISGRLTMFDSRPGGAVGETSNVVINLAWLRDIVWTICKTHGMVSLHNVHPELRVSFVHDNLKAIWDFRESGLNAETDPALDFSFRLHSITMTAVEVVEQYGRHPGSSHGKTIRDELVPYVTKCLSLFLHLNGSGSYTTQLVKALARLC